MTKPEGILNYADIVNSLTQISDKIENLHECSSRDFNHLSISFKKYFKKSKDLSEKANLVLSNVSIGEQNKIINELNTAYKEIYALQKIINKNQINYNDYFASCNLSYNELYYLSKNFEQNLLSLDLIMTNFKLSANYSKSKELQGMQTEINLYTKYILKNLSDLFDEIGFFTSTYEESNATLSANKNVIDSDLTLIVDQIYSTIIFYSDKQKESSLILPKITESTKNCSADIEGIIKYLQYHDIIKQKMEHIHKAQEKLLNELNDQTGENETITSVSLLNKVGNIASLQSAQLLRANKEYQDAINHITKKLNNISDYGLQIFNYCKDFTNFNEQEEASIFKEFITKLVFVNEGFQTLTHKIEESADLIDVTKKQLEKVSSMIENTLMLFVHLRTSMKSFMELIGKETFELSFIDKYSEHFETLKNDYLGFGFFTEKFNKFDFEVADKQQHINENVNVLYNIQQLVLIFQEEQNNIDSLLTELFELSNDLSGGVRESVKKVEYYDCFDKTVKEIIEILNLIKGDAEFDKNDIENLRQNYTVKSEHEVHEHVLNKEEVEKDPDNDEEEENDVEFF